MNSYGDLFDLEHRFPADDEPPPELFRCVSLLSSCTPCPGRIATH